MKNSGLHNYIDLGSLFLKLHRLGNPFPIFVRDMTSMVQHFDQ